MRKLNEVFAGNNEFGHALRRFEVPWHGCIDVGELLAAFVFPGPQNIACDDARLGVYTISPQIRATNDSGFFYERMMLTESIHHNAFDHARLRLGIDKPHDLSSYPVHG